MTETQNITAIPGRAFPSRSSREVAAELSISGDVASVLDQNGAVLAVCPVHSLHWDMPVGRAPRRASLPDGTLFEAIDNADVDKLRDRTVWHRLHRVERFGKPLILFSFAAIVGAYLIWRLALPAMVGLAVMLTPESLRTVIDLGSLEGIDRTLANPTTLTESRQAEIQAVFASLLDILPDEDRARHFRLHFRSTPLIGPNAFALPGGTVVITDQLVTGFDDTDVIASVLAHEIGHVAEDHGLRQLYRSVGVFVLVALIAGDTGPILEDVLLEGGILLSFSFSRAHEQDADSFGLRLADAAGYDPSGLLTFFEALPDAQETDAGWMSTHPSSGERIKAIRDYLDTP